ncbi:1-acyl-sn-glycerol-3-phosphate acyltransferase [Halomicronema hongdechloris C2206]|uniref:1-acyl-sn-glycerol-3-phosphate acyltransferase n=1 Tax=Halomicronema hongdechloris C2206 TaxID=1641165 RepID=A0A1Z3HNS0_9CYAN|nr:1-acyl-sn-glycerol-3-phosphate acyltransferase [Halomicronema hongdechloris]ASC71954.1 1-acyl-sn-glycerol-3-phosphate acyltransferase [Halomicronema hongdechloris C2206]
MVYLSAFTMIHPDTHDFATMTPQISRFSPWLTPLVYCLGNRLVLPAYFGTIRIHGIENLPQQGPVILAPTHRSRWDALLVPYAFRRAGQNRYLRFMVTADEVRGIQGWFIRRLGGFAINVSRPTIASLRHGIELLQQQEPLVIFPEGGIFRDEQVHPLKPGLARLALQAESLQADLGIHIVPVSMRYGEAMPSWGCEVTVEFGRPLLVRDYLPSHQHGTLKAAAQRLTQALQAKLTTLHTSECPKPLTLTT